MKYLGLKNILGIALGAPPRPTALIERNFPANIITIIEVYFHAAETSESTRNPMSGPNAVLAKIYEQAEKAILQINRHNQGKPFDSVSVLAAYKAGER